MSRLHLLPLAALVLLAACDQQGGPAGQVRETKAPGHIAAGGGTSGAVIAAAAPADKQAGTPGPAGTPGIPKGSEGNTGGAGITTGPSGASTSPPPAAPPMPIESEKQGTATPSEDVKTGRNVRPPGVNADAPAKAPQ